MNRLNRIAVILVVLGSITFVACDQPAPRPSEAEQKNIDILKASEAKLATQEATTKQAEQQYIAQHKREAVEPTSTYRVSESLNSLSVAPPVKLGLTWQEIVGLGLHYFVSEPALYSESWYLDGHSFKSFKETDKARQLIRHERLQLLVAYGLLQVGNSPLDPSRLKPSATAIFNKTTDRDLVYHLVLPSLKIALTQLPNTDKQQYISILRHTRVYMDSFNANRESEYLAGISNPDWDCRTQEWQKRHYKLSANLLDRGFRCEGLFTMFGPDGKDNPYRKAEAFVYRRVKNDGWSISTMKTMLDRLLADL